MNKKFAIPFFILLLSSLVSANDNPFTEVAGRLSAGIFSSILIFGIVFIAMGVLCFIGWYLFIHKRKFDIMVKINSRRADDKHRILFDKAAILYDRKDKTKYLRIWGLKVELPLPTFNLIQTTSKGDFIEFFRTAEDQFYYVLPPKVNQTYFIKDKKKLYPIAKYNSNLIDPNMAFWSAKRKDKNKSMFDPEKIWMKILPFLPHILTGVLVIFVLWILMNSLPEILSHLTELTSRLAEARRADVVTSGLSWSLIH